jgi:hypothetical protein
MAINREWRCFAHGAFESDAESPTCPHGCDTVEREFRTPPAFASARTKSIDNTLESLARSHGMTDINNRGGRAAKGPSPNQGAQQASLNAYIAQKYGSTGWGAIPKEKEGGAPAALSAYGGRADNALAEVRDAGALVKKPVLVRHDHENLKVDISKAA